MQTSVDHATRRRMADVHPDALDLLERLTERTSLPTTVLSADVSGGRTTFEIELSGRRHRLTLERTSQ